MIGTLYLPLRTKNQRVADELQNRKLHPKILLMLMDLAYYSLHKYDMPIEITEIFRTDKEQYDIYKDIFPEDKIPDTLHKYWRAADVVPVDRTKLHLAQDYEKFLDARYKYYGSPGYTTSDAHNVGKGMHLHMQVGFREGFPKEV